MVEFISPHGRLSLSCMLYVPYCTSRCVYTAYITVIMCACNTMQWHTSVIRCGGLNDLVLFFGPLLLAS